jgi:hypothetical protein
MTKSAWVLLGTIVTVTTLEASKKRNICTIRGEIYPAMALRKVWLIQDTDTLPVYQTLGKFQVSVKPGKYSVWIDAIAPYQDLHYKCIELSEEETIELGRLDLTPGTVMFSRH